jgi:hypothetical protein
VVANRCPRGFSLPSLRNETITKLCASAALSYKHVVLSVRYMRSHRGYSHRAATGGRRDLLDLAGS